METLQAILHDPATALFGLTFAAIILAKLVYPYLERMVKKTETLSDDQFLVIIEGIVNDALTKATVKAKTKAEAKKKTEA